MNGPGISSSHFLQRKSVASAFAQANRSLIERNRILQAEATASKVEADKLRTTVAELRATIAALETANNDERVKIVADRYLQSKLLKMTVIARRTVDYMNKAIEDFESVLRSDTRIPSGSSAFGDMVFHRDVALQPKLETVEESPTVLTPAQTENSKIKHLDKFTGGKTAKPMEFSPDATLQQKPRDSDVVNDSLEDVFERKSCENESGTKEGCKTCLVASSGQRNSSPKGSQTPVMTQKDAGIEKDRKTFTISRGGFFEEGNTSLSFENDTFAPKNRKTYVVSAEDNPTEGIYCDLPEVSNWNRSAELQKVDINENSCTEKGKEKMEEGTATTSHEKENCAGSACHHSDFRKDIPFDSSQQVNGFESDDEDGTNCISPDGRRRFEPTQRRRGCRTASFMESSNDQSRSESFVEIPDETPVCSKTNLNPASRTDTEAHTGPANKPASRKRKNSGESTKRNQYFETPLRPHIGVSDNSLDSTLKDAVDHLSETARRTRGKVVPSYKLPPINLKMRRPT